MAKVIDDQPILSNINFELPQGGFLALLGPNGAGKSTLLHALSTLSPATHGKLELFGQSARRPDPAVRARIGMIGHQPMLYSGLSAAENLAFFGKLYRVDQPGQRAGQLLERVGLADRAEDPVMTFSRGMVQRLAIARALMHDPDLILADEPFSGLDVASTAALEQLLTQLHEEGKTIILVSHDIAQGLRLAERVVVLRRGRIVMDRTSDQTDVDAVTLETVAT